MDTGRQRIILLLTIAYFFIELFGGLYYRSLALVTDASFMAINITGQIIALYVARLSQRLPTKTNPFGYERAKVISGLFNGILVGFLLFYVFIDAYHKIMHPQVMDADRVLLIAVIGLAVNVYGFISFYKHSADINLKGALLLISNDALGSVGVIAASLIIKFTGLSFVDPLTAVILGLLVAYPTYFLLRDSVHILMEGTPAKIDPDSVEDFIYGHFPDVRMVKDIHIWGLSPEKIVLAARIRTNGAVCDRQGVKHMKQRLLERYGFFDIYLEIYQGEQGESSPCIAAEALPETIREANEHIPS
jgi:cobalt-zinc-cadmium efflux system protein